MRGTAWRWLLGGAALLLMAGCATSEEWAIWKENTAHFASGEHFRFSMKNAPGASPQVSRDDLEAARAQNWWGRPITVRQEELLER